MKIIYIANIRIPTEKAHGRQIMEMSNAFVLSNNELELIVPNRKNPNFKYIDSFKYYKIANKFKIKKIKTIDPLFLMKFPAGTYIKFQSFFFMIGLFFHLLFLKNRSGYIFYTRDEYLLPLLNRLSKKVYWECHNLPSNTKFYLKHWNNCAGIITITNGLKKDLMDIGVSNNTLTSPDGVDLDRFFNIVESKLEIRKKLKLPQTKKIILYSGHLYSWKGAQTLADASDYLSDYMILFVGGTSGDVKSFKKINVKKDNVFILGHRPHDLIPRYLKAADVLVLPNSGKTKISSHYTSPLKLFEYMSAGVPIVASDLPSIREILNTNNSVLFKADDPNDLADKIKSLVGDDGLGNRIGLQASKDVRQYSWQKRAVNILKFINVK